MTLRRLLLAVTAGIGAAAAPAGPAAPASVPAPANFAGDVIANLWSWNWRSVTAECTDHLGPAGFGAVWVAPPAESLRHPSGTWWDVYQPYSYELTSRFGTETEFTEMIEACHRAGLAVFTDAVINHTAALTGVGYAGTELADKYDPPMYDRDDYHVDECPNQISRWTDAWEVQHCELLGLPDLATERRAVRDRIAGYLDSQLALGVDGFRIDAAKHIPAADLTAIYARLASTWSGAPPFIFHEVFPGGPAEPEDYFAAGAVLDFDYADRIKTAVLGDISILATLDQRVLPPEHSVTFVTNHDTERNRRHLSYEHGATTVLANVFQLAWPHGRPTIYSGFEWATRDQGPPNDAGFVTDTDCGAGWVCLHRDPAIVAMTAWHNAVGAAPVTNWQSPAAGVIGFRRGTGFVALNNGDESGELTFATGLADGSYCNVIDDCATTVDVVDGTAELVLAATTAVAVLAE